MLGESALCETALCELLDFDAGPAPPPDPVLIAGRLPESRRHGITDSRPRSDHQFRPRDMNTRRPR